MNVAFNHEPVRDLMNLGIREDVFPGAVLLVGLGDRPVFFEAYGKANLFTREPMVPDTIHDLASLTKPLATTLAVARLVDRGCIDLDQPVGDRLTALSGSDKAAITTRQLLSHRSGLPAHDLIYTKLKSVALKDRKPAVLGVLKRIPLACRTGEKTLYSDLGFMLLCRLIETVAGCPLDRFLNDEIYAHLGLQDLFFVDLASGRRPGRSYAATELCPDRSRLLVGEVHDDNTWWVGGVDGHAGLFGNAAAVFQLLRVLVGDYRGVNPKAIFSGRIMHEVFHGNKQIPIALGFDRPTGQHSSAGRYFSTRTVGHLGFTGVSFWMDLDTDVSVILLTNRVHPFRWNNRLQLFRPRIHDRIMEQFDI